MDLQEWHDFFIATLGAAAALTGLIFVGVSINIAKILSISKLPERALLSLGLLMAILWTSALMLIPGQSATAITAELSGVTAFSYLVVTRMDIAIYRGTPNRFKRQYAWSIVFNQLSLGPYLAAVLVALGRPSGLYWLAPAILVSFTKAVIDAWVLLVEINR